ncbi:hypothetical protein GGU11DRAFT_746008 [Lentinula aff. detonsa]|nr:hypothetical protein GGU11DRAFT_746008 [Lentinula aff. detonsa]
MAPPRKTFHPDQIEENISKDLYRCKICFAVHSSEAPWMKRGSVKDHLDSSKHASNYRLKALKEQEEGQERRKYERTYVYSVPLATPNPSFQAHTQAQVNSMFPSDTGPFGNQDTMSMPIPDDLFLKPEEPTNEIDMEAILSSQFQELLAQALYLDEFGPEEDHEEDVDTAPEDDDESDIPEVNTDTDSTYDPYPSKVCMLLDILDNLPRLRLSNNSIKLILWMLKVLGVNNVPSFNKFRTVQECLRKECGVTPDAHVSDFKNHYHSIDPRKIVAQEFANPCISEHITLYPERTGGRRGETWQFDRWTEYSPSQLTPMFARGLKQFWIEEVAQLDDGSFVIPHNWINVTTAGKKELSSDCSDVCITPGGWIIMVSDHTIPASRFVYNYDDIISHIGNVIPWAEGSSNIPEMPNSLRPLADGDDLYVIMMPLWCDDVSGNKSKQYNKHINIYSVNGSLPGQLLQQEYFVNFISTSPHSRA